MNILSNKEEIFTFGIDDTAKAYLLQTARWTKFLAIIGFISIGLMLAAGFSVYYAYSNATTELGPFAASPGRIVLAYALVGIIYFYPVLELIRFSIRVKSSVNTNNQQLFNTAMRHQRNMFRYLGVLTIVLLVVYGILITVSALS